MRRKKEKLKNKKARQVSRAEVLRKKDPKQMLDEMYDLDEQEYILSKTLTGQENVVKDKKRKIKLAFERLLSLMQRENKEKYEQVKKLQHNYEMRKRNLAKNIEEKNRQAAASVFENDPLKHILPNIPLPNESALKEDAPLSAPAQQLNDSQHIPLLPANVMPPGPPPCEPPPTATKIPDDILAQFIGKTSNLTIDAANINSGHGWQASTCSFETPLENQYYNYLYDPLPPPPPPPPRSAKIEKYSVSHSEEVALLNRPDLTQNEGLEKQQSDVSCPSAVISADPQLRDMQAEVTRLIPTSILRKRDKTKTKTVLVEGNSSEETRQPETCATEKEEKEEVFAEFLRQVNS